MQLPKTRRRQKLREKICTYKDCGKAFFGIAISKYCHKHREEKYRIRKRSESKPSDTNRIIPYEGFTVEPKELICQCCGDKFPTKLFPKQTVYPNWCPSHRNENQRKQYLKNNPNSKGVLDA